MKTIALIFAVLWSAAGAWGAAQPSEAAGGEASAAEAESEAPARDRPPENELLIGEPLDDAGQGSGEPEPGSVDLPGVQFGDLLRMMLVLGLVIALIYAFFWMLRRISGVKASGAELIDLLATRPLKGDAALHLVETGSRLFLVGSTASEVNLVAEIDDKESIDQIRLAAAGTAAPRSASGGFARRLRERFAAPDAPDTSDAPDAPDNPGRDPITYLRNRRNRVKQL